MSDQCAKIRITEFGGYAGNVPRPPRIDIARSGLNEAQLQSMDEACRQLLTLAGVDLTTARNSPTKVGADIDHGYFVEIEAKNGEPRSFKIPYPGRQGSALESTDINAIVKQLEGLSPSAR